MDIDFAKKELKLSAKNNFWPVICLAGAYSATPAAWALGRCAMNEDGLRSVPIYVSGISAEDVRNNAESAWRKIAMAADKAGSETNVGHINLVIFAKIFGKNVAIPGSFPMYFSGAQSLTAEIMNVRGIPLPGGKDPKPCDPEKNACCAECVENGWALLDPVVDVLNGGFYRGPTMALNGRGRRLNLARLATGEYHA